MPIYEYRCDDCGDSFEVMQKMSDDPLDECEQCGGTLRKVLHPVAIHFKGSGFYTTDYGKGSGRRTGPAKDAGSASRPAGRVSASGDESSRRRRLRRRPTSRPDEGKPKEKQKAT